MMNLILALSVFAVLFSLLLLSVLIGRRVGQLHLKRHPHKKLEVVSVAEGAVFALLGLLIAFTYAGAYDRFEARKGYIIEEANAMDNAWMYIGLLKPETQMPVRVSLREYIDARINTYKDLPTFIAASEELNLSMKARNKLWQEALTATNTTDKQAATMLLMSALNNMFDIANKRVAVTHVHTPAVIFILLLILSCFSSFLAGYSTASNKHHFLYIFVYTFITAFTIYIIFDLEAPRIGLIRVDSFDFVLENVKHGMH